MSGERCSGEEMLGHHRTTPIPGRVALVRLDDNEPGSVLNCWNCYTNRSISRELSPHSKRP